MKIHGLQKLTLLDFPEVVACTVFLGGCDFRCPFCHNAELLDGSAPAMCEDSDLLDFLWKKKGLLDGVCITGGEPTLRPDLGDLIQHIKEIGYKVKLDTAGYHPEELEELLSKGNIDYVAMDIKNSRARYAETVGLDEIDFSRIEKSISLLKSGSTEYEFRTTVLRQFHDEESFKGIAELVDGADKYFIQSFIDRETVPFAGLEAYSKEELESFAEIVRPHVKEISIRGVD